MTDEIYMPFSSSWYAAIDPNKIPYDIVCNGFKMIDVIVQVLNNNTYVDCGNIVISGDVEEVAKKIQDEFAIKLRLKQP